MAHRGGLEQVAHGVVQGTKEVTKKIASHAATAMSTTKDFATEAIGEVKNLPLVKGIVGFFSR